MPSGPPKLHEEFGEPWVAEKELSDAGFKHQNGLYSLTLKEADALTVKQWRALCYLIYEWDYAWKAPTPVKND